MDSFHYKTYVHLPFSEENFIACFEKAIRRHIFSMHVTSA